MAHTKLNLSLKPLWIRSECTVSLGNLHLSLPEFMVHSNQSENQKLHEFCLRLKELGYDSLLIGSRNGVFSNAKNLKMSDLSGLHQVLKSYDLKLILKLQLTGESEKFTQCVLEGEYKNYLTDSINEALKYVKPDYWFWEANLKEQFFSRNSKSFEMTGYERILAEAKLIEDVLSNAGIPLIFYLPSNNLESAKKHADWLLKLSIDINQQTILAFPMVSSLPWHDHASINPFFESLRKEDCFSYTALMPIINIGSVSQGEGFWPVVISDSVDEFLKRFSMGYFVGAIGLCNYLPQKGSFHDCNLVIANKSLYHQKPVSIALEEWISHYWPEVEMSEIAKMLNKWRAIALDLSALRVVNENKETISNEESRLMAESLLSEIKCQQLKLSKIKVFQKRNGSVCLADYFTYFARDAKHIIEEFLYSHNQSLPDALLGKDEPQESFWTTPQRTGKATLLAEPQRGSGIMEQIYCQTRAY